MFDQVLEEDAARPVDDAFGASGGARRVQDVQRVVKGEVHVPDHVGLVRREELVQRDGPVGQQTDRAGQRIFGNHDEALQGGQGIGYLGQAPGDVVAAPAVAIAVGGEEDHRPDLPESVDHPGGPEVRRRRREGCADGRGGQHHGAGLGHVGHPCSHPVAGLYPEFQHGLLEA